jgi:hypothetical protein
LSLCLTKHHAMKTYWRSAVWLHAFLTSALDGGEWSASRQGHFTPREKAPGTPWTGGWVGLRAGMDVVTLAGYTLMIASYVLGNRGSFPGGKAAGA